ncbi:ABC transporter substrate-binding protein [Burkholderia sp. Leaf177]|uniref:ABC transporter substrate-binding protein n=1 Tax=Burkholderia sp. Leaf177 TaxID=1736287 RepID=UPI0007013252|nr:ABC transporter substrate-binding protein [Burkholderia sp. Leaf177]KQR77009.1 ABC transporter substrate-binding protein [Burkholderia sp. Leaf177]
MMHKHVFRALAVAAFTCLLAGPGSATAQTTKSAGGTLVVGTAPKYPPFESKDPETGNTVGFDVDIIEAVAAKMGSKVEWQDTNFDQLLSSITTKRLDLIVGGMADTQERQASVSFLDYLRLDSIFYTLKTQASKFPSMDALCGKRVGTARRTIWPDAIAAWSEEHCVKQGKPAVVVVGTDGSPDTRLQLNQSRIDAAVQGAPTLPYQNKLEGNKYVQVGTPFLPQLMGMGFRKNDAEFGTKLKTAFNAIIADGTYKKILTKWGLEGSAVDAARINGKQ